MIIGHGFRTSDGGAGGGKGQGKGCSTSKKERISAGVMP